MKFGSSDVSAFYLGGQAVSKIYLGSTEVWSAATLPVFVAASSGFRSGGTWEIIVAKPSGVADDDTIYAFCWHGSSSSDGFTATGWTLVSESNGNPSLTILKRTVSGDGAGYIFANTGRGGAEINLVAYTGGDGTVDATGTIARTSGSSISATSITPSTEGVLLAAYYHDDDRATISSGPSGMTQRIFSADALGAAIYELSPSPAGATGAKSITWDRSDDIAAILMQIT